MYIIDKYFDNEYKKMRECKTSYEKLEVLIEYLEKRILKFNLI